MIADFRLPGWMTSTPVRRAALVLLCALALFLPFTQTWQSINYLWLDQLVRWRAAQQPADPDIAVVAIDEYSVRAMSGPAGSWPWPRSVHAELVEGLKAAGAEAVIFDVWFSEPDRFRPEHDAYFGEILDRHENVFLPTLLLTTSEPELAPRASEYPVSAGLHTVTNADPDARIDILLPAVGTPERWQLGLINFIQDHDGKSRRYPVYLEDQGWRIPSLPARVLRDLTGDLPGMAEFRLDWTAADVPPYSTHAYADLYEQIIQGRDLPEADFADKWVLIGATASGLHDLRPTPIDTHYPGVYILATALDNLKHGRQLKLAPAWYESLFILFLFALFATARIRRWGLLPLLAGFLALTPGLLGASYLAASRALLLPVFTVVLFGWLLFLGRAVLDYWQEYQARRQALDMFGRFLDPKVVGEIAEQGLLEHSRLARDCTISILFSDIRNFTTLSESRPAVELMALLNEYFSRQVDVIFRHEGTLDKFIGDAIMAFWGAPVAMPDHADRAISAALDMVDVLEAFRKDIGMDGFDIGIGIHTGLATVGMLGSERRYDYTAIGDTVNTASRIEGLTKDRARILVSEATVQACKAGEFDFRNAGCYQVKGRQQQVTVFEPRRREHPFST